MSENRKIITSFSVVIVFVFLLLSNKWIVRGQEGSIFSYLPLILNGSENTQPTEEPQGVMVLPNHTSYVSSSDENLHIIGEVNNNTEDHLRFVKVNVKFFDINGELLDSDFTYTLLDNVPAGEKACFDFPVETAGIWSYFGLDIDSYWTDGLPFPNLSVTDLNAYLNSSGQYEIYGQITNSDNSIIEFVTPVGTLYNAAGMVIGCDFGFVDSYDLNPTDSTQFQILFLGRDYSDVASYRIQVEGDIQ